MREKERKNREKKEQESEKEERRVRVREREETERWRGSRQDTMQTPAQHKWEHQQHISGQLTHQQYW